MAFCVSNVARLAFSVFRFRFIISSSKLYNTYMLISSVKLAFRKVHVDIHLIT